MIQKSKSPLVFYIYYFVMFLGGGIHWSFLNLYLSNAGMPSTTIGLINGTIQILSLLIFPIWGRISDRASTKNKVLVISLILSIILLIIFSRTKSLIMLGIMTVVYSVFYNPLAAIYETITMAHVVENGWNYSPIRMTGTFGYSFMALVAGFYLGKQEDLIFPIYIAVLVVATITAMMIPKTPNVKKPKAEKNKNDTKEILSMLKNKSVRNVLILMAIYNLSNTFNSTYFGIFMSELGGDYTYVGIANMIMGLAEVPFHIGPGRRWMKKIGIEKSMVIVMFVGTVRWLVAASCKNAWVLVGTMAFNGIMLVPTIVGVVEFLYENAPDHLKASVSTTLKSPFQITGQIIANFGGGALVGLLDAAGFHGIRVVYIILAPVCLTAGLLVGIPLLKKGQREE